VAQQSHLIHQHDEHLLTPSDRLASSLIETDRAPVPHIGQRALISSQKRLGVVSGVTKLPSRA
jgi:hypothetical protein